MAYTAKPGSGSLFKNDRKEEDRHPDYNGKILLPDGTEHYLNAWIKTSAKGSKYMSLSIGKPTQWRGDGAPQRSLRDDLNDEVF
jgi:hypothetical protein